jgi:hypothetical protein
MMRKATRARIAPFTRSFGGRQTARAADARSARAWPGTVVASLPA